MNLSEQLKMKGELSISVFDKNGNLKTSMHVPNLVVTAGKVYIASRMVENTTTIMSHMAIGEGATAPVVGNTALGIEAGRVALDSLTSSSNTITATATFPAGTGTGAITEAGIFNSSSAGSMLCRTTFPVVNKQAGDTISVTWVVTVN